jgi:hypothetical protein
VSLVCDSVAPFWISDAFFGSLRWPKRSLTAGPLRFAPKVHLHKRPVPRRVPHRLSEPSDLSAGPTPWVSRPVNDNARSSPCWSGSSTPTPGSALRLSQPLSGFPASPSFAALFHAAAVRDSPFRGFPSQESRAPPRAALLPCGHPPTCRMATARALSPPVSGTPTLSAQLPPSPDDYGIPFHAPESTLPAHPGPKRRNPSCSASFTRFEALILLRVRSRSARVAPDSAADPLLGFRPSRVFTAQASDPAPTQA